MPDEIKAYIRLETKVSAAFNFFINGMLAALIYHKADTVPTNIVSIPIDLLLTCLLMCILSAYFCSSSLKRTKTAGIFESPRKLFGFLGRMLKYPLLYGLATGTLAAIILSALIAPAFMLIGISTIPFFWYVALKALFATALGSGVSALALYSGMCKP